MAKKMQEPHYTDNLEAINFSDLQPKDHSSHVDMLYDLVAWTLPDRHLNEAEKGLRKLKRKYKKSDITSKFPKDIA